ncbi:MAG: hypothetical protein V4608_15885 [Bacteroidota bacterium]
MENERININLSPQPYQKRQQGILSWTFLLYLIILIAAGLNTSLNGFMLTTLFLGFLFVLDYSRRLRWVKYALENLDTDQSGVKLKYYDKEKLLSTTIPWEKLSMTTGTTFTKNPKKLIAFKNEKNTIASFYATDNFDNEKIEDLYKKIKTLKLANA